VDQKSNKYHHLFLSIICLCLLQVPNLNSQDVSYESILKQGELYPLLQTENQTSLLSAHPNVSVILRKPMDFKLNNYVDHLSFFCKLEVKTDRKAQIPVRLRLGTVDYVDKLEMKIPGLLFAKQDQTSFQPLQSVQR
jgi:hypothetical protein